MMTAEKSQLLQSVLGCLLGSVCGDAMGQPRREMDWMAVRSRFGDETGFAPWTPLKGGRERPAGRMGSLMEMVLDVAHRSSRSGAPLGPALLLDALLAADDLESLPARAALARVKAGVDPTRSAVPELAGPDALYLAIPCGIAWMGDPQGAFLGARALAGPVLIGPALTAGQVAAAGIAEALMRDSTPASVLNVMLDVAPPSVATVLTPAARLAREHLGHPVGLLTPSVHERFASRSVKDPHAPAVEALAVGAFFFFVSDGLPAQTIPAAAAYGGWAHACATVAGALSGALHGVGRIPAEWASAITSANPAPDLEDIASGLCALLRKDCARQRQRADVVEAMAAEP